MAVVSFNRSISAIVLTPQISVYLHWVMHGRSNLKTVNLGGCRGVTDIDVSALGHGCCHLKTFNLRGCQGITDIDVSALRDGCSELTPIGLSACEKATDIGIVALGHIVLS
jgi:hypothetical protein